MQAELILASTSPRRRRMLAGLGLEFKVRPVSVPEREREGETPAEFVRRLAEEKAGAVSRKYTRSWVLGADTVVVLDEKILCKPVDPQDAERLLSLLAGRRHEVLTGFCLCNTQDRISVSRVVRSEVQFARFPAEILAAYVRTGEPLDKAGAYGIQSMGGFLVEGVSGSYSNVVGLPLAEVVAELIRYAIIAPCSGQFPEGEKIRG